MESGVNTTSAAARALNTAYQTQNQLLPALRSSPGDVWESNEAGYFVSPLPSTRHVFSVTLIAFPGEVVQQDPKKIEGYRHSGILPTNASASCRPVSGPRSFERSLNIANSTTATIRYPGARAVRPRGCY